MGIVLTKTRYIYVTKFYYSNAGFSDQQYIALLVFEFKISELTSFEIGPSNVVNIYSNKTLITVSDIHCGHPESFKGIGDRSKFIVSFVTEKSIDSTNCAIMQKPGAHSWLNVGV